jgi:hypothetical protein
MYSMKTKWRWIEKLLQTPIYDYRKLAVWRILVLYLINMRLVSDGEAYAIVLSWLEKCHSLRRLDFNPNYMIKYNINTAKKGGYLPISLEKQKTENSYLHKTIKSSKAD